MWVPCLQLLADFVIFAELSRKMITSFPLLPRRTNSAQTSDNKLSTTAPVSLQNLLFVTILAKNMVGKVYSRVFMKSQKGTVCRYRTLMFWEAACCWVPEGHVSAPWYCPAEQDTWLHLCASVALILGDEDCNADLLHTALQILPLS